MPHRQPPEFHDGLTRPTTTDRGLGPRGHGGHDPLPDEGPRVESFPELIEDALDDVEFPATRGSLQMRHGTRAIPVPGDTFRPLGILLAKVEATRFESPRAVREAILAAWPTITATQPGLEAYARSHSIRKEGRIRLVSQGFMERRRSSRARGAASGREEVGGE